AAAKVAVQVSSEKMNGKGEVAACCLRRCFLVVFFPVGGSGVRRREKRFSGQQWPDLMGENGEGK
ncbi:hypothetical protein HAX54_052620, partial [Datura stramonium]|nr:hypothetical protein [Datura stramonium]